MRKFLITGATSSGKTTLLRSVAELLKRYDLDQRIGMVRELARPILRLHPEYETNPLFQDLLFMAQLGREAQAEAKGSEYLLCDRGSLDIVVFARIFGQPVKAEWLEHLRSYEIIFVCQADFPLQITTLQQQVSSRDWSEFRTKWQAELFTTLQELQIKPFILEGNPETRLRKFLGELSYRHQQGVEGSMVSPLIKEL